MKARKAFPMFGILFAFLITPPVIRAGEFGAPVCLQVTHAPVTGVLIADARGLLATAMLKCLISLNEDVICSGPFADADASPRSSEELLMTGARRSRVASFSNKETPPVEEESIQIFLYNPVNGVTRNFMPHLWMFPLQQLTPPGHEVLLIDGNA
jgi:hypothetical protein